MASDTIHPALYKIYKGQGLLVQVGWLLLLIAPLWAWATNAAFLVVMALCALYLFMMIAGQRYDVESKALDVRSFFSLDGVVTMLRNARAASICWLHILAFDLFVGLAITVDAQVQGISHLWIVPILFATLMFGPAGLLFYAVVRLAMTGQVFGMVS